MNPFLARFHDQPALVDEGRGAWLEACLRSVSEHMSAIDQEKGAVDEDGADFWQDTYSWVRPYIVRNGILHIPVKGVLLNDFPYAFGNWATGYEYIWEAVKRGSHDPAVKGIALVINSGGGMVSGNFDLVDRIYAARSLKPIHAFAAEHAYSAAYNIASAASRITVARTGGVGSIGVVVTHFEYSRMLDERGVTVNIIRSKPGKMEGNHYEALSEGARARIQERVDEFHNQFVAMVARNRGMETGAVDETNALTFMPQQAIENGLADDIGALDDAITAFEASFREGDEQMAEITQADLDTAVAQATESARTEGHASGVAEGASAERERITAILGSEAGQKRPKAALAAALETDLSVEQATKFLGNLAEEAVEGNNVAAPRGMLKAAMSNSANPEVEAGAGEDDDTQEMSRAERTRAMFGGLKAKA